VAPVAMQQAQAAVLVVPVGLAVVAEPVAAVRLPSVVTVVMAVPVAWRPAVPVAPMALLPVVRGA